MSTNQKNKFSTIWDDLDNMRKPKSRLAGIFDQIKTTDTREDSLLRPDNTSKKKPAATDKKHG